MRRPAKLPLARALIGELEGRLRVRPDVELERMADIVLAMVALTAGDLAEIDRLLSRADEVDERLHNREPIGTRFQADHAEAVIGLGDLPAPSISSSGWKPTPPPCRDPG